MYEVKCKQQEDQWYAEKLGKPSSSRFDEILTASGTISKQRQGYMYELAAQTVSGQYTPRYITSAMEEGISREAESRSLYEIINGVEVVQTGVIYPNKEKRYLCSPDGIIAGAYGLELKNVLPKTQVKYLLSGELPTEHVLQVQGSLLVTGFDRWDWMSYSPGLPVLLLTITPNRELISKLEAALQDFAIELALTVRKLKEMG